MVLALGRTPRGESYVAVRLIRKKEKGIRRGRWKPVAEERFGEPRQLVSWELMASRAVAVAILAQSVFRASTDVSLPSPGSGADWCLNDVAFA